MNLTLPSRVKLPDHVLLDEQYNAVADYLSEQYGYCVNSFEVKGGYAVSIKWDTSI